jgi:hypothetical protein
MTDIFDDEKYSYEEFDNILGQTNKKYFGDISRDIKERGSTYTKQLDKKKSKEEAERSEYTRYILKNSNKYTDEFDLSLYDLKELKEIYLQTKRDKQSVLVKFIRFIIP